jgi:hypothetical protein
MAKGDAPRRNWVLWWVIDPVEIDAEVAKYRNRNPMKTARGVSALLLLLSVLATGVFVLIQLAPPAVLFDAALSLILAVFVYFGFRWAIVLALIWWTFEKAVGVISQPLSIIGQLIWWCGYMRMFWLAFRVEQARRNQPQIAVFE